MLTLDEQKIKEECEGANPGPWFLDEGGSIVRDLSPFPPQDGEKYQGVVPYWAEKVDESEGNPYKPYYWSIRTEYFVANSRTNIPLLLDRVDKLREEIDILKKCKSVEVFKELFDLQKAMVDEAINKHHDFLDLCNEAVDWDFLITKAIKHNVSRDNVAKLEKIRDTVKD